MTIKSVVPTEQVIVCLGISDNPLHSGNSDVVGSMSGIDVSGLAYRLLCSRADLINAIA